MGSFQKEAAVGITIKQAYEQGSLRLVFTCARPDVRPGGALCGQVGKIDIEIALASWGGERRLDQIRARCSRCGSAAFVSVHGEPPGRTGKRGRR
jgi:ribosomal protein S27AE